MTNTPIHKREVPDGFELGETISESWRVGHVFRWSEVYECFLDTQQCITVKPDETPGEAFYRETNDNDRLAECEVFFVKEDDDCDA
jgi:hypothetical protein